MHPTEAALMNDNAQEDAFCRAWVKTIDLEKIRLYYVLGVLAHLFLMVVASFVGERTHLIPASIAINVCALPILIFGWVRRHHFETFRLSLRLGYLLVLLGLDVLIVYASDHWLGHPDMLIVLTGHLTMGALYPHADRQPPWLIGAVMATHIVSLWFAMALVPMGFVIATLASFCYLLSALIAHTRHQTEWRIAQVEYRFRATIVPEHIVRHSANHTVDVTEIFKPAQKFCVCLASNWRHYQSLSAALPNTQLTASLNAFHQWCQNLARSTFPNGNYYTDWFADELFLVVYADEQSTEKVLVNQTVRFGVEILKYREEFARVHGIPQGIDIGISSGPALVGVMGPDAHLKATALGEPASDARRLQVVGQTLRQQRGDKDRVILTRSVFMVLSEPHTLAAFHIDATDAAGELMPREIYYIEADAGPEQKSVQSA